MKRILSLLLVSVLLILPCRAAETAGDELFSLPCTSALLMERETGTVLYAKKEDARLSPASVTKIMTMLLVCEAIESGAFTLEDTVTASRTAAAMGGSQIWLEEGEQMSVGEMLKCVAVVSANDCAVALAEKVSGSESAFTARMNERAAELGLANTHFSNCTGLSSAGEHYSCARDIAVMARQLLSHELIRPYTTIWTDTIRGGKFGLTNTNKLVHSYDGCTGLKTGFTSEAMFCLAASAMRDGTEYIAVILHGDSSADRFDAARTLLDYAFANYALADVLPAEPLPAVSVLRGQSETVPISVGGQPRLVIERARLSQLTCRAELPSAVEAPVTRGQELGRLIVRCGEEELASLPLTAAESVERSTVLQFFHSLLSQVFG